jgi:hypothetical protein
MLRTKDRRSVPGRARAYTTVRWLNISMGTPANARIIGLLKIIQNLEAQTNQTKPRGVRLLTWKVAHPSAVQKSNQRRVSRLATELNRRLSRYKIYPEIFPRRKGRWFLRWRPLVKGSETQITVSAAGDTETYPFTDGDILLRILGLAEAGDLHRLRKCWQCGNWLFARVRHQNYCNSKCQQLNFRTSDKFKDKRKRYMRKHRRDERDREKREGLIAYWRDKSQ